ncbi:aminotransferase class I/II-fold pyridoxal phosphate-dependent enzyme [Actinoallomurus soli]|uniref:aminotransferase class I/II-fold pyridoxal phosphate-dependent enzyme n=1 Tax=Actinoallomurus soli TaxID=2952535 RepID=UPI00209347E8|nr:aminotransferase class I/II-fold pyridoxal phosphate-dependent enzyme [Actinoallomurus soli]MCO5974714.1 aminotransferase class I/II-fold pyridoxal phosphate-dependent enzyme [Actinoallomurus soli]
METFVVLGGSGFIGGRISESLLTAGHEVTVVDRRPPPDRLVTAGARWLAVDALTDEPPRLPDGTVVVSLGMSDPRPRWPWLLPVGNAVSTARILPALAGHDVVLLSSVEVYGSAEAPLREDTAPVLPWTGEELGGWCDDALLAAREACPLWRVAPLGRRMAEADPTGRWIYGMSKLAQERLVRDAVDAGRLTVLRLANVVGVGQDRFVARITRKALAGHPLPVTDTVRSFVPVRDLGRIIEEGVGPGIYNVGAPATSLVSVAEEVRDLCGSESPIRPVPPPADDTCGVVDVSALAAAGHRVGELRPCLEEIVTSLRRDGTPSFDPPVPVVIPPRAALPDEVAARQQQCLWTGEIKHGNRWSEELRERLAKELDVPAGRTLLVTTSGTSALRLVIAAVAGPAAPGEAAVLPSFTFPATAEVLLQLGYRLRFIDVDERGWTLDPEALRAALSEEPARVVVCVDTFGNPCRYEELSSVCAEHGAVLVADSAAALGSRYRGRPVASQADGHSYSMSFAKVLSAGGAGGAAVLPADAAERMLADRSAWWRSELMHELHAIYALDQLQVLEDLVRRRNRVAEIYRDGLSGLPGLRPQETDPDDLNCYVHWVVRIPDPPGRPALERALLERGVHTKPYFRAAHLAAFGNGERLPVTERLDAEALALPMSSELTVEEAEKIVMTVRHCYADLTR